MVHPYLSRAALWVEMLLSCAGMAVLILVLVILQGKHDGIPPSTAAAIIVWVVVSLMTPLWNACRTCSLLLLHTRRAATHMHAHAQ